MRRVKIQQIQSDIRNIEVTGQILNISEKGTFKPSLGLRVNYCFIGSDGDIRR